MLREPPTRPRRKHSSANRFRSRCSDRTRPGSNAAYTPAVATEAWDVAGAAARRAGVDIRPLTELADADAVNGLIRTTWGGGSTVPRELIRALQASGSPPLGALAGDRLVGYALGFLGPDPSGAHLHSHMLAVLPEFGSRGVGQALKLAQRAWRSI